MESLRTALACIILLFSLAAAQYTPKAEPSCQQPLAAGGSDYLSHETYCQLYYRCDGNLKYLSSCGTNLFFNAEINNCDYPRSTACPNWPCTAANNGTRYPHVCNDQYFTCIGVNMFAQSTCPAGQRFDIPTGTCVVGAPVDNAACSRAVRNDTAPCYHKADQYGDPCKFQTVDGNITHTGRSCPDTMAFNETSCGCTIPNAACPKPTPKNENKRPDPMCRASTQVTFDNGELRVYSQKISANLNDSFQATGVTYNNGIVSLTSSASTPAQFYWFYANGNELTRTTGFVINFRSTGQTTAPIYLLTNNYNDACTSTLNVTATFVGTTYTVTASAVFMTRNSMTNITYSMDTVSTTLSVATPSSYVEVILGYDTLMRLKLTDKGPAGTTTGQVANRDGTVNLGTSATYAYNKCGYAFTRGLTGDVKTFAVHEGCLNITTLLNR